eukprot:TRINITY_DN2047_c0_g1_i4.p1 TRINITY_DN2047_c0_g1~~TRINITY_DN2047_c0_g1_i4.p1  ORF type:complete len:298 (-),score=27.25 TRINITY_DN2047_c0_g1_i4:13-906(-)
MFSFGRSPMNDFSVTGYLTERGPTMSRFAFRLEIDREPPHACRVFAGGFDDRHQIFIGDGAISWNRPRPDGFVTNGVRVMYDPNHTEWLEVSCRGSNFTRRPDHLNRGQLIPGDNILTDGSIISVGGLTFIWQSGAEPQGWTRKEFNDYLNTRHVQCPVQLQTIHFVGTQIQPMVNAEDYLLPWVFPSCGHVHGYSPALKMEGKCTLCRTPGVFAPLRLEPDPVTRMLCSQKPTRVFNPCGHAIDDAGADRWCRVPIPTLSERIEQVPSYKCCPYCRATLDFETPHSRLLYQMDDDS